MARMERVVFLGTGSAVPVPGKSPRNAFGMKLVAGRKWPKWQFAKLWTVSMQLTRLRYGGELVDNLKRYCIGNFGMPL